VLTIAGMEALDVGFIAVAARVERWPSGHLGQVGGEALRVLRMKPRVCERMLRHRIGDAELMPALAHGEDRVVASELCVKPHGYGLPRKRRRGQQKIGCIRASPR